MHVLVELVERLAVPLGVERCSLERRRARTLQIGAVAGRASLRVGPSALVHLVRREPAGAVGPRVMRKHRERERSAGEDGEGQTPGER